MTVITWTTTCYFKWGAKKLKLFLKNVARHGWATKKMKKKL